MQCDGCRKFSRQGTGWYWLSKQTPSPFGGSAEVAGTFCTAKCVADYFIVLVATESASKSSNT